MSDHKCNCPHCEYEPDPFEGMTLEEIQQEHKELLARLESSEPISSLELMQATKELIEMSTTPWQKLRLGIIKTILNIHSWLFGGTR